MDQKQFSNRGRMMPTNYGIEHGLAFWKFSGNALGGFLFSLVLFIGLSVILLNKGLPLLSAVAISSVIPFTVSLVLVQLVVDKPSYYFVDWFVYNLSRLTGYELPARKNSAESWIEGDKIVIGSRDTPQWLVRGLSVTAPSWENAADQYYNDYENAMRSMLQLIKDDWNLQIRWATNSDFDDKLQNYFEATESLGQNRFTREIRNFHACRFHELKEAGLLRQSAVQLYVSVPVESFGKDSSREANILKAYNQMQVTLDEIIHLFQSIGGEGRHFTQGDYLDAYQRYFRTALSDDFDFSRSMSENLYSQSSEAGQEFTGYVALHGLPQATMASMIQHITALPMQDYWINLHLSPINVRGLIDYEQMQITKQQRSLRGRSHSSTEHVIERRKARIGRLMNGDIKPCDIQLIIGAHAANEEALSQKLGIIQTAIYKMAGAKPFLLELPTSKQNALEECVPAAIFRKRSFKLYSEDICAVHLLPVNGSSQNKAAKDEALFQSSEGGIVGINTFSAGDPLHAFVTGMTGSGKSCGLIEIMTQTEIYYDRTIILDTGRSHETYAKTFDAVNSIVIEAKSEGSINYLGTAGQPLTDEKVNSAASIVALMAADYVAEKSVRTGLIHQSLRAFYKDWAESWIEENPQHSHVTNEVAYQYMDKGAQPMHRHFQQWLTQIAPKHPYSRDIEDLAVVLSEWLRDGGKYSIFDGEGSIDFSGQCVHIELGQLQGADTKLKAVAAYLITQMILLDLMYSDRSVRKRLIVEELGAFLEIPNAKSLIHHMYERLRKYRVFVVSCCQQLSQLNAHGLLESVVGNSRQAFLFKTEHEDDARALQSALRLPESAVQRLMSMELPSKERGAPFLHWSSDGVRRCVTSCYNIASPEMLYISASGGEHYEARAQALAQYDDVFEAIQVESKL